MWRLLITATLGLLFVLPNLAGAAEGCEAGIEIGERGQAGFGVPYTLFDVVPKLLIEPVSCNGDVVVRVGGGEKETLIYPTAFVRAGNAWQRVTLTGSATQGAWLKGTAAAKVSHDDDFGLAVYMCQKVGNAWKCGCSDQTCTRNQWTYQSVQREFLHIGDDDDGGRLGGNEDWEDRYNGKWLMGYYPSWDRDRLDPDDIDWQYLTHIAYGALAPLSDGGVDYDFALNNGEGEKLAKEISRLAKRHDVVPMLFIGGGAHGRNGWVGATSPKNVETFAKNLIAVMDELGYQGIDVDWEPLYEDDLPQIRDLARALKKQRPGIPLSMAVPSRNVNLGDPSTGYDYLADEFDRINIMTYDMGGAWGGWSVWHHSALDNEGKTNPTSIESSVRLYKKIGVPSGKIGIGAPFYGYCWQGDAEIGKTVAGGIKTNGAMSYRLIMREYYDRDWYEYDRRAEADYLLFDEPTGPDECTMISYMDTRSAEARAKWADDERLGGIIIWSLGQAHMDENSRSRRHPLLRALAENLD